MSSAHLTELGGGGPKEGRQAWASTLGPKTWPSLIGFKSMITGHAPAEAHWKRGNYIQDPNMPLNSHLSDSR